MLAATDYTGTLNLWDIRSSVPLGSNETHQGKALSLSWLDETQVVTGGSDCCLKSTKLE